MLQTTRRGFIALGLAAAVAPPAAAAERILIRDLYAKFGEFSERAEALAGERVVVPGFMAPPLKADAGFFVLTKRPMAVCPFCDNEADWPMDIILVRLDERDDWVRFNVPIEAEGVLELGTEIDEDTGFVSRIRLTGAAFRRVG